MDPNLIDGRWLKPGSVPATALAASIGVAKQYVVGTAYTNGTPSITCAALSGFAVARAVMIPYQTQDGAWRMRFNIVATFTAASVSSATLTLSGVTFKTATSYNQAIAGLCGGVLAWPRCYTNTGAGTVTFDFPSATSCSEIHLSGDVELDSKPTWAD